MRMCLESRPFSFLQPGGDRVLVGKDTVTNLYNFTGQVLASYLAHNNPNATANSNTHIKTNLNYDHANRLLEVYKTINDADSTKRLLARSDYDQMGLQELYMARRVS